MKIKALITSTAMAAILAACGGQTTEPESTLTDELPVESVVVENLEQAAPQGPPANFNIEDMASTNSGLQYLVEAKGDGPAPAQGDIVQVHYTAKLGDGTVFDDSYSRNEPIAFALGQGMVIPGWDEGISLLNVGDKAKLAVPAELAYGEYGVPGVIPPNAPLYFEVELLDILPGGPEAPGEVAEADFITTDSGLKYADLQDGNGVTPEVGQSVVVHYTGWLEDGTKFDSSLDRGQPFVFPIGQEYVIPGWDEGIASMEVGGKRQLVIPAELAYGADGAGGVIPPNATLIFEVELLDIQS